MRIQLSDHFTYRKLLRFTLPSIVMMVFTSIYGVVDGLFVSNFVGKGPFTAVNLVMPVVMIFGGLGFMFGTGGSALVAKTLGQGRRDQANRYFTMIAIATVGTGIVISALGAAFMWAYLPLAAGRRGDHCRLRPLWPDSDGIQHGIYAAKCIPKLPDYGGKAEAGPACDDRCRGDEYGAGRAVHCRVRLGCGRRRRCDRAEASASAGCSRCSISCGRITACCGCAQSSCSCGLFCSPAATALRRSSPV